ncbi:exocyst complex component EXO70B1-like [Lotus japonicus]|uniref:exocyst complex component EXO70B1-like n=1 Tax=Lotus japonicus TaxID=34305 RepID=UPI0025898B62|nr:exocyst complex component EXO70B1-like [Lotus japonicus]XP_057445797.1 exocyst complex component EXO70B1-like [Lotus japonicus]XP_057445798.1 exocyst complex component EXO70B1-like [Lotus japonicus]
MENDKNLSENSDSFARKDEDTIAGDAPPVPEHADNVDAKSEGETEKPADADHVQGEPEEEATVEVPPETPPPSLEKVSEDIDLFLANNDNKSTEIPDFVDRFMDLAEEKVAKFESGGEAKLGENAEEDSVLFEAVNRISKLMKSVNAESQQPEEKEVKGENEETEEESEKKEIDEKKCSKKDLLVNRIGAIHQRVMSYLEEEFRLIMEECRKETKSEPGSGSNDPKGKNVAEPSDSEAVETVTDFPGFPEEAVTSLNKIAREMISGGYEAECCHVYAISRKLAFEESLRKFGYEKISADEVQKIQWETLEREIPTWINTFKECTAVWFPGERKLAESVFAENPDAAGSLYGSLSRSVAVQLLNFAESVAMTKRAGEKLFKLLDMYEALRDAIPKLENLFPEDIMDEVKAEMTLAKCRLGEAAVLIFCELENSIKSETGRTPVAGGAVHPLTRYIMNYLRLACEYKDTLEEVFKEHSKIERADSTSRPHYDEGDHQNENNQRHGEKEKASPFATQLMRVMELLDSNLEGKAKLYKEVALSCIFMMNNGRYIVQKIKGSAEIYQVMGETWTRKRSSELRTYHKNYQIETWSKILGCLSPKGLNDNGKVQKPMLKERFKTFNTLFEDIHKTQSTWVVSDEQLQSELRVSISSLVIPAYRSFLGRFSQYLDPGRQTEKYIKYQAEDIENYIDELFDGNPHHQGNSRKKA